MKKAVIALGIFLAGCSVHAQSIEIENIAAKNFKGLQSSLDGNSFYMAYFIDKPSENGNFAISFYDQQLNESKHVELTIPDGQSLAASAFTGENLVMIFTDPVKKTRILWSLDRQGNTLNKIEQTAVVPNLLNPGAYKKLFVLNPSELLLVRSVSGLSVGYDLEHFSANFDSLWTLTFAPAKGEWSVADIKMVNDRLYILRKESNVGGSKYKYSIQSINLGDGKIVYTTPVGEGDELGFPTSIKVNPDMSVTVAGLLFPEGITDEKSAGIFIAKLNDIGNQSFVMRKRWDEIHIKDDVASQIASGSLNLIIEDVAAFQNGNRYIIIGETFEKSAAGNGDANFAVNHLLTFYVDKEGEIYNIDQISRQPKKALIKGSLASDNGYNIAQDLYAKGFFTYRNTLPSNDRQVIMYRYDNGNAAKMYFIPSGDSAIAREMIADVAITQSAQTQPEVSTGKKKNAKSTSVPPPAPSVVYTISADEYQSPDMYNGYIPLRDNRVLTYEYATPKLKAYITTVSLP